jgi:hypothetical protein
MGFEPTTPALQRRCSARLSYVPIEVRPRVRQPALPDVLAPTY